MTNPKSRDWEFLRQLTSFTATVGLLLLAAVLAQGIPDSIKIQILPQLIAVLGLVTLALTRSGLDLGRKLAKKAKVRYTEAVEKQSPSQLSRDDNCDYRY